MQIIELFKYIISIGGTISVIFFYTGYLYFFTLKNNIVPNYMNSSNNEKMLGVFLFLYFTCGVILLIGNRQLFYFDSIIYNIAYIISFVYVVVFYIINHIVKMSINNTCSKVYKIISNHYIVTTIIVCLCFLLTAVLIALLFKSFFVNIRDFLAFDKGINIYFDFFAISILLYSETILIFGGWQSFYDINYSKFYLIKSNTCNLNELIPETHNKFQCVKIIYEDKEYLYLQSYLGKFFILNKNLVELRIPISLSEVQELGIEKNVNVYKT